MESNDHLSKLKSSKTLSYESSTKYATVFTNKDRKLK